MEEKIKKDLFTSKRCNRALKIMRTTFLMFILSVFTLMAEDMYPQQAEVSLNLRNSTLKKAISEIERNSDYVFLITDDAVSELNNRTTINVSDESIQEILETIFQETGLAYNIVERQVSIYKDAASTAQTTKAEEVEAVEQQKRTVTGVVIDEEGEAVIGANIMEKGTTNGVVTDFDGNFSLSVADNATLVISYIGYVSQEVKTAGKNRFEIVLSEDTQALEEVVVVAYGEQKRSSFTGSATVVGTEAIAKRPISNVMDALEGMTPGVHITSSSGQPYSSPSFRIRGTGSINASNSPLIVLDGVPYEGGWNNINPHDVESITVLKDAASTAIYGARGGNGVILVTTKSAKRGEKKMDVSLETKFAISKARTSDLYDVIESPGEYYELHYKALNNYYRNVAGMGSYQAHKAVNESWTKNPVEGGLGYMVYDVPDGQYLIGTNGKLNPNATLGNVVKGRDGNDYLLTPDDWLNETFKTGLRQDYNLRISGASENMSLLTSFGYTNDEGIAEGSFLERFTARMKGMMQPTKWFRLSTNIDASLTEYQEAYDGSDNSNNIFSNALRMAPIFPIYIRDVNGNIIEDENGKVYDYGEGTYNDGISRPVSPGSNRLQEGLIQTRKNHSMRVGAKAAADFFITPELTVTLNVSYDQRDRRYVSTRQPFYGSSNPGGTVSVSAPKSTTLNLQQLVNYRKSFGDHSIRATLLHEYFDSNSFSLSGGRSNMFNYFENQELAGAITQTSNNSSTSNYQSNGYGGRVLYDFKNVYNFDASFRRDASSRFHPDHRWGNFFSFGAAYLISKEDFFNVSWIDELKIKASFGQNGNDGIGNHRYVDTYEISDLDGDIAVSFLAAGNKRITWETRTAINTGIEFELFKGRLRGGVDYYNNTTSDMLASVSVPYYMGYSSYYDNIGKMRNTGLEFELSGDIIRTKDFTWSMYANASTNKAKVLELAPERTGETLYDLDGKEVAKGYRSGNYFIGEGIEYRTWNLKKFAGINEEGKATWYERNEETGEIGTTDVYAAASYFKSGSSQPKLLGGFGGAFAYKRLSLNFAFAYRLGGMGYDGGYASLMALPYNGRTGYNFHVDARKAWTPENPSNDFARWQFDDRDFTSTSDRWQTNASYLSLQNISLAYRVPRKVANKMGIQGLSVSAGVDNIFFWSKRKGYVPSRSRTGSTGSGDYPNMSNYMLNLSFKF